MTTPAEALRRRAQTLQLHGLLAHWPQAADTPWVETLIGWEESERTRRSLERRLAAARLGRFKPLADFDWNWPTQCDRGALSELLRLEFIAQASNVILVGPSGLGKTTLAQNIAYEAVLHGHTVLFASAGQLLGELAALDSDSALRRRLRHYAAPALLVIDEVGYLSYSDRHADLLFELINRRYEHKSTMEIGDRPRFCGNIASSIRPDAKTMPRRSRICMPGVPLHIIQRGNNRSPCFFGEDDYRSFLACQRQPETRLNWAG